jgi:hypothetical protein
MTPRQLLRGYHRFSSTSEVRSPAVAVDTVSSSLSRHLDKCLPNIQIEGRRRPHLERGRCLRIALDPAALELRRLHAGRQSRRSTRAAYVLVATIHCTG